MPTRNSWSPWKVLLVAVLGCAVGFAVLVGSGVYWLVSVRNAHRQAPIEFEPAVFEHEIAPATNATTIKERIQLARSEPGEIATNGLSSVRTEPLLLTDDPLLAPTDIAVEVKTPAPPKPLSRPAKPLPGDDLFKDLLIPKLAITIPPEGMSALSRNQRKYVRATIQEGEKIYTNVAIRIKGGPGSRRDLNDKPAFTINFDEFAPGQTFHGLKKIHLNNSVQDGSYLEEKISRELFEAAGVPVPRAGHAFVHFNRREMGMYVLVEGINKQFLKRYFEDAGGNVYDGKSGTDVTDQKLLMNSGDNRTDESGRKALAAAGRELNLEVRLARLEKTLDLDRFLSYMAMEMILWHWDGYTMARNNWRVFHDRAEGRMVFIPQGMDQMLNRPTDPVIPPQPAGFVARAVLEIPEARKRYRQRVMELSTNVLRVDAIHARINEVSEKIQTVLAEEVNADEAEKNKRAARSLRNKVQARANYLRNQFFPVAPVKFTDRGAAPLSNWQPKIDVGEPTLNKEQDENGSVLLHIAVKPRPTGASASATETQQEQERGGPTGAANVRAKEIPTASWRTRVPLEPGKYRFEARIKTRGVILDAADKRSGAGLRISRFREGQKNLGNKDWTPIVFDFEVSETQTETELVCELRADEGEIWYDLKSLKLRKL
jgi:hypothetical protein